MAENQNNLSLSLEGEVNYEEFAESVKSLRDLIKALTNEVGSKDIELDWIVTGLSAGSAHVELTAHTARPDIANMIVESYYIVGTGIANDKEIPYGRAVKSAAKSLAQTLEKSENITSMTFRTPRHDSMLKRIPDRSLYKESQPYVSFGAIEGKIQALNNRGNLNFGLYDNIFDKRVNCYLKSGQEEMVRNLWGKDVIVEGNVSRDEDTGLPKSIRDITKIEVQKEFKVPPYEAARGILQTTFSDKDGSSEEIIRRLRDG